MAVPNSTALERSESLKELSNVGSFCEPAGSIKIFCSSGFGSAASGIGGIRSTVAIYVIEKLRKKLESIDCSHDRRQVLLVTTHYFATSPFNRTQ
jgi:hypothetical protein